MASQPAGDEPEPAQHYYIATEDLYVHHPESGVMPAAAFRVGDQVPADLIDPNGWASQVRLPDLPPAPPPRSAPATAPATPPSKE